MALRKFRLQLAQPVEEGASLVNPADQHNLIEGGLIADADRSLALCLQGSQEAPAGFNLLLDHSGQLLRDLTLDKVEFDEEEDTYIARSGHRRRQPVVQRLASGLGQTGDFAGRAYSLLLSLSLDHGQALQLFQKGVKLAHFDMDNLAKHLVLEALK